MLLNNLCNDSREGYNIFVKEMFNSVLKQRGNGDDGEQTVACRLRAKYNLDMDNRKPSAPQVFASFSVDYSVNPAPLCSSIAR